MQNENSKEKPTTIYRNIELCALSIIIYDVDDDDDNMMEESCN
jgi:hypothetical protein